MAQAAFLRLVPGAPKELAAVLDGSRGPVQPPIRSEIFGQQRFAQHGRSLAETHRAERPRWRTATFFPRLRSNIETLREAHRYIGIQATTGYDISPAAEWLLDNFHLIEAQLKQIHEGLPRSYFRSLPVLQDEPLAGLPRVYGVAWAFVAHTDGAFDDELLQQFLIAYQQNRELNLAEMWALPTTLRVVLIENLRRLAERVATNKAARAVANLCCDRLDTYSVQALDELLALLHQRGVARVFLAQMAQRLQDRRTIGDDVDVTPYQVWLSMVLPDLPALRVQQSADQAADNLSVSNAVSSLRAIGDADWSDIIAHASVLMQLMLTSPVFAAEHSGTRDRTLHDIESLARRSGRAETDVARALLARTQAAPADPQASVPSHWLRGPGRAEFLRELDLHEQPGTAWAAWARRNALPLYLGALALGLGATAWSVLSPGAGAGQVGAPGGLAILGALLMLLPLSEAVVAVINRLISESARPRHLPRLALADGIPPEHRVMVVIPGILTRPAVIRDLVHRLQLHYLANPERNAQFALLTDWADADSEKQHDDAALLDETVTRLQELNRRHPLDAPSAPRFILLHRKRQFSQTEQKWIGWERKRGKLEQLVGALAEGTSSAFLDLGEASRIEHGAAYVVTLDSDTQLPPGRLRELVGLAAHPHNQPCLDEGARCVVSGYGILQPHIATPLPAPKDFTLYHWLFAGQCGIDPYSVASSEIYQDIFAEGTFTGKGLLHVRAVHAMLSGRLPQGQVLSHDLLEGSLARCAVATDINVIEDAPFHADVGASRVHRWTRGDWQLLPFLFQPERYPLRGINRWKMYDNLRRSLVAPASLALLLFALHGDVLSPWTALALVVAAFTAGPLMGAIASFSPSRDDLAKRHYYSRAISDLARALWGGAWHVAQLVSHSILALDAIVRALYRMLVSRRHLLQWTTSAAAQAQARTRLAALAVQHWKATAVSLALLAALWAAGTPNPALSTVLCLLWAASPVWTWIASRPRMVAEGSALSASDDAALEGIARDTWRLFERCVGPEDRHLPPDNLQTLPHDMVAHRTSPSNIGLYLLATACARAFGWIGTQTMVSRLEATLATLDTLPRHRGHFLNWYDTTTGTPLLPMYVSTVDSGNLSGHLLAVAQACLERAHAPLDLGEATRALRASQRRLDLRREEIAALWADTVLMRLLAIRDPLAAMQEHMPGFSQMLDEAEQMLGERLPGGDVPVDVSGPAAGADLAWLLFDHVATLRSAWADVRAAATDNGHTDATQRLRDIARRCEQLAWEADYTFLYHRKRHLFHIGYRVAEQELDAGFYDLLASESRLTSLLAIAKGDVPVSHWASLGRPFYAVGKTAGLRSWSGSMFEYLMPTLVLHEPHGSVLRDACQAALSEQIAFAKSRGVPWGISESAYAGRDHTLAYQYTPQGVPRLALRRTPADELVIAPYATALASQVAPRRAIANFGALEQLAARSRYGFIEALDFTAARLSAGEAYAPVSTFMAHHQGMSIVALANVLLNGAAQRWGMANPYIEAVSSLLHERAPREVSMLHAPPPAPAEQLAPRGPGLLRDIAPGTLAIEPTHVLSNGRYSVSLRPNGAGGSRWGAVNLTRSRDDALRDTHGSFFYLRWGPQPHPVSITQRPAPDPEAQYSATYHADRVCFDAAWPGLQAHTTVWVGPEDDIELRRVELRNLSDKTLTIELISAFEITLADPRADEAHPAFTNLFVQAEWLPAQQALMFERRPRLATERGMHAAHFLAETDPQVIGLRLCTDRERWRGRNHDASQPLAAFAVPPPAGDDGTVPLDTGLDPMCAMAVQLRIAPRAKAQLTFATAASDDASTLRAVVDKHRQTSHVQRASLMSATLTGIRLRALGISADNFAAVQSLTTALALTLTMPRPRQGREEEVVAEVCDRRTLWRFGISGDRPILLVSAGVTQGVGLLRTLAQALGLWSWGGIACDLVVVSAEPASYVMALQREITSLRERHLADGAQSGRSTTGFHLLRTDELSAEELSTLQNLARVRLYADGRPLLHHIQEWIEQHEADRERRQDITVVPVPVAQGPSSPVPAPTGTFSAETGEFRFGVSALMRPPRPWINVLSNPEFGAQISEAGGGYTWAVNSRLNQLTAWSNDPVADPPSEWFLLQDRRTLDTWSVTPSAWGDPRLEYRVSHGQGDTTITHRRGDLDVSATWCVDTGTAVKQIRLRLINRGHRTLHLRVAGMAEWMMGTSRSDRSTVFCTAHTQRLHDSRLTTLLCTQRERTAGYGNGTAFLALADPQAEGLAHPGVDWTCDRRECFDAWGRVVVPERYGQQSGEGLDPCAALSSRLTLQPGEETQRVFLLGYGASPAAARELAASSAGTAALSRQDAVREHWDALLSATTVKTPDPLFDAMVNRWLLYQSVACRLWAKAGFYQAGGATGFRDQLQDAMALAWARPDMLRQQILTCASRQFPQGDVQHWWHAPTGAGVRTHFSDDLLWLPFACAHYLRATGENALLDEAVPFIDGNEIPEGAEDAYDIPEISHETASVYEHAARTIDRSLRVGVHGLPLMGTGDWNDGMNRVGHEGRGESVWLGWFLCQVVSEFAPIANARGDTARARRWLNAADGWRTALRGPAWDGQWFKRAFFDNAQPLGSHQNEEGRIDLIAQAWSVLSGAAAPALQRMAMAAVDEHLVQREAGLIQLLDPPLARAVPSAGYIQAYPPGVRENAGQYSHAGVWSMMAQARMRRAGQPVSGISASSVPDELAGDTVYRYFTYLSPAHRSQHPQRGPVYGIEPYVMAGDVYTQPPYTGRGGWSWYTGAAAWMHRAAIESVFGLSQTAETMSLCPCLPSHWPRAELRLRRGLLTLRFILVRALTHDAMALAALAPADAAQARLLLPGDPLAWQGLEGEFAFVIPTLEPLQPATAPASAAETSY